MSKHKAEKESFKESSRLTIERIRRDHEKAQGHLKDLFYCLEADIFDSALDVNELKRRCGKRDRSMATYFTRFTGMAPHAYIVKARIETAACLLADTELPIWRITALVGFSHESVLYRNFKAWCGSSPTEFRKRERRISSKIETESQVIRPAEEVLQVQLEHSPAAQSEGHFITIHDPFTPEMLEEVKFNEIWQELHGRSWQLQRYLVRERLRFSSPGLFHLLRNKSRSEGRENREYGIHLAELAMDCLRVTEELSGEIFPKLRCQGWMWVGNARRLAFDFDGAEKALSIAQGYLSGIHHEPFIVGEFYALKAALRRFQRRLDEALELHDNALPLFRSAGDPRRLVEALLERGNIHEQADEPRLSIRYLREAIEYTDELEDSRLKFAVYYNLASVFVKVGNCRAAASLLPAVRRFAQGQGEDNHVRWLEGSVHVGLGNLELGEDMLVKANRGFQEAGSVGYAALVDLDLALLYSAQGKKSEAQRLSAKTIPIFESLKNHEAARAALAVLNSRQTQREATAVVILEIRKLLNFLRLDPMIKFDAAELIVA